MLSYGLSRILAKKVNKLLFVVSDYLPNRNGGTIRVEKNIKYLRNILSIFVFCPDLSNNGKHTVIDGVEIHRTYNLDISNLYYSVLNFFRLVKKKVIVNSSEIQKFVDNKYSRRSEKYVVPDVFILWAVFYFFKLLRCIVYNKIDVVYSSSPASSNHLIVLFARFFLIKEIFWVVEFRDPWITNPFRKPKNRFLEFIDSRLEKVVIAKCNMIIVTSQEYRSDFISRYGSEVADKIYYHPNGFDSADFGTELERVKNEKFVIISAGDYYDERSLLPFLLAFKKISDELGNKLLIEFIQYGKVDVAAQQFLEKYHVCGIKINSPINHLDCLVEMRRSDLLLLVTGPGKGTIPGKTYEYLATYKPILSLIDDETPVSILLKDLNVGPVLKTSDILGIYHFLLELNTNGLSQKINKEKVDSVLKIYDRKSIAMEIYKDLSIMWSEFKKKNR